MNSKKNIELKVPETETSEVLTPETNKQNLTAEMRDKLIAAKNSYIAGRTSTLTKKPAETILNKLLELTKLQERYEGIAILTLLFQQGGTARSCDGNLSVSVFSAKVKLADLRKIMKEENCNKSERKLARYFANEIHEVASLMEIPGNLYSKIQRLEPERTFSMEEKAWLSDFQSDNPNCPAAIRKIIYSTFPRTQREDKKLKKTGK